MARGVGTDAFSRHLASLVERARPAGLRAESWRMSTFSAMCLWPDDTCQAFRKRVASHDTVGVVGCESAVEMVARIVPDKPLAQLAQVRGIANLRATQTIPVDRRDRRFGERLAARSRPRNSTPS